MTPAPISDPPPRPLAPTAPDVELTVARPAAEAVTVRRPTFTLRGYATSGSEVVINGRVVPLNGTRFSFAAQLKVGENRFEIEATKEGFAPETASITIERRLPLLQLAVRRPASPVTTVRAPSYTIVGVTTPGARLLVRGNPVALVGRRFEVSVGLNEGRNVVSVRAEKRGFASRYTRFTIIRRLTPEEVQARLAQKRQAFIDSTISVPYDQLIKNPDRYSGTKVRYYGEILQIQESGGGGIMLLYVTDLGYDIWTDQIWVNYIGHVRGAAGDELTVYGTVVGTKSYETQIGGETYVPEIDAKYIAE
jgi:hypothetical protein